MDTRRKSSRLQFANHTLLAVFSTPRISIISKNPTSNAFASRKSFTCPASISQLSSHANLKSCATSSSNVILSVDVPTTPTL